VPGSSRCSPVWLDSAFVFGLLLVMPIGSADMPVVMSLLNSYAGLASAATGFVLSNKVLIIAGTLDGFSGFILSILMCRAMNRSMTNVLFGAFGSAATAAGGRRRATGSMREVGLDDIATQLAYANKVIFVPGYGLATARRNTQCASSQTCSRSAASLSNTEFIPSRAACPVT
jgi:NAD(P) transhydrogenase subunit beta